MLGRVTRGLAGLSPYINKQRQFAVNLHQFIRPLSQSSVLSVTNQVENDETDLMFDLGGAADNGTNKQSKASKLRKHAKNSKSKNPAVEKIPSDKKDRSFDQLKYQDLALNLTYVKLPFDHPELSNLMLMLKSRKYRETKNLLLIEGRRLTLEAVEVGLKLRYLLFSNVKQIEQIRSKIQQSFTKQTEFIRVPHNDLSFWSTLSTCPGLISVFEKPKDMSEIWDNVKKVEMKKWNKKSMNAVANEEQTDTVPENNVPTENVYESIPITVICDQVREPNNLGGIIRTCAAIPCSQIVLLKGCADPWDIKSLRGGCGAQFRVPIVGPIEWEELTSHLPNAHEMSVFIADNQVDEQEPLIPRDSFEKKRKETNAPHFPAKVYSDVAFHNCKHIALVVGGETEGVSSHAFDFMRFVSEQAKKHTSNDEIATVPDNSVIEIPLGNGIESLNASVATAILLFEMRKQLIQ